MEYLFHLHSNSLITSEIVTYYHRFGIPLFIKFGPRFLHLISHIATFHMFEPFWVRRGNLNSMLNNIELCSAAVTLWMHEVPLLNLY
uniref:Uncharacterized protein n=1 Tax=Arundo donax TaxID=35708 RepID=A0A0A9DY59_ARUDO